MTAADLKNGHRIGRLVLVIGDDVTSELYHWWDDCETSDTKYTLNQEHSEYWQIEFGFVDFRQDEFDALKEIYAKA